jgi:hypothetical protein
VNAPTIFLAPLECFTHGRVRCESAVANGARDSHEFLIDNSSCSDILMADFGISHHRPARIDRQSDILAACPNQNRWEFTRQSVIDWGFR